MGNMISLNSKISDKDDLSMSNGLTDVFINVLSLSGSKLAKTVDEKRLIVWLSEKDQSSVGSGTVGFDISDMPWNIQTFEENRQFLLQTIKNAKEKISWEMLDYEPDTEFLFPQLDKFYNLIEKLNVMDISQDNLEEWLETSDKDDPIFNGFPLCQKHKALLTVFGCQICNN